MSINSYFTKQETACWYISKHCFRMVNHFWLNRQTKQRKGNCDVWTMWFLHKDMRMQLYQNHGARFLTTRTNLLNGNVWTCCDGYYFHSLLSRFLFKTVFCAKIKHSSPQSCKYIFLQNQFQSKANFNTLKCKWQIFEHQ